MTLWFLGPAKAGHYIRPAKAGHYIRPAKAGHYIRPAEAGHYTAKAQNKKSRRGSWTVSATGRALKL
jgi:hypothetical protein